MAFDIFMDLMYNSKLVESEQLAALNNEHRKGVHSAFGP